jgi:hypothetical protein
MLAIITRPRCHTVLALYLVLALLASAGLPGAASAELSSGGLVELANKAAQEEATATATTATSEKQAAETSSAIPSTLVIVAVAAGALLLGGIAFVIVRDARSVAPVVEGVSSGTSRDPQAKLRKRRAKAKAAKRQRKRNR